MHGAQVPHCWDPLGTDPDHRAHSEVIVPSKNKLLAPPLDPTSGVAGISVWDGVVLVDYNNPLAPIVAIWVQL